MTVNDYIISNIKDPLLKVLEIGPWHGMLSDALYENGIDIHASEVMKDAFLWTRKKPIQYPCYNLSYNDALHLKDWDIVIATNVISHLNDPFLFLQKLTENSKRIIISSTILTDEPYKRTLEIWGPDSIAHVFPVIDYKKFLEEHGWIVIHCDSTHKDFKDRTSWVLDAIR